jgi:hypothetical protein
MLLIGVAGFSITIRLQAHVSGWKRLVEKFGYDGQFEGRVWGSRSANFRNMTTYWSSVIVGANVHGLYLAQRWPINKLGHLPILVPWSEIEIAEPNWTHLGSGVVFLGAASRTRVTLSRDICAVIAQHLSAPKSQPPNKSLERTRER